MERRFQIVGELFDGRDDFWGLFIQVRQHPLGGFGPAAEQFCAGQDERSVIVAVMAQVGEFFVQFADLLDTQGDRFGWQ